MALHLTLEVLNTGARYAIVPGDILGSAADSEIPIPGAQLQHCRLKLEQNVWFVEDISSSGTELIRNGHTVTLRSSQRALRPGDVLNAGGVSLLVHLGSLSASAAPVSGGAGSAGATLAATVPATQPAITDTLAFDDGEEQSEDEAEDGDGEDGAVDRTLLAGGEEQPLEAATLEEAYEMPDDAASPSVPSGGITQTQRYVFAESDEEDDEGAAGGDAEVEGGEDQQPGASHAPIAAIQEEDAVSVVLGDDGDEQAGEIEAPSPAIVHGGAGGDESGAATTDKRAAVHSGAEATALPASSGEVAQKPSARSARAKKLAPTVVASASAPAPRAAPALEAAAATTKARRKSTAAPSLSSAPVVVFTMLPPQEEAQLSKQVQSLGGVVSSELSADCTLVAEKVALSVKACNAVTLGCPIVTPRWITDSSSAGAFLPTDGYAPTHASSGQPMDLTASAARRSSLKQPLLSGLQFCGVPNAVLPASEQGLQSVITTAGGKWRAASTLSAAKKLGKDVYRLADRTLLAGNPAAQDAVAVLQQAGFKVYAKELVTQSVVEQQLAIEEHLIAQHDGGSDGSEASQQKQGRKRGRSEVAAAPTAQKRMKKS